MAQRLYQPVSGDLQLWSDPRLFVKADLQAELTYLEELQALSLEARTLSNCSELTREDYDDFILDQIERIKDILDFFDYDTKVVNLTVANGAWFKMEAVESFCGEEVGQEATLSIDDDTGTFWQHNVDHAHEITWRLRTYRKRISKVRVYLGTNARSKLENLDIYAANSIGGLTLPSNLAVTGASVATEDAWNEIEFTTEQIGRYVRFAGFDSQNTLDQARIREVEAWVETQEYD